jgi:hypothetical protein
MVVSWPDMHTQMCQLDSSIETHQCSCYAGWDRFIRQFSNLFYFLQYKVLTLLFLKPVSSLLWDGSYQFVHVLVDFTFCHVQWLPFGVTPPICNANCKFHENCLSWAVQIWR